MLNSVATTMSAGGQTSLPLSSPPPMFQFQWVTVFMLCVSQLQGPHAYLFYMYILSYCNSNEYHYSVGDLHQCVVCLKCECIHI